ncbi:MAG: S46 family peptidase, partial [Candidatus Cryptobacteroides sp.]
MKKFFCTLSALLLVTAGAWADEGMWLLPLIQKMNGKAMKDLGCRLTPEEIYGINNNSLKDAIVQFGGGCTGEIISDQGLLVTNHHCGYSSIQGLSTPEHNYLEDGYWAMSNRDELPVEGLTVKFLQSMTDVTPVLEKAREAAMKEYKDSANVKVLADNAVKAARESL